MARRHSVNKSSSARKFRQTNARTKIVNAPPRTIMRGGYRL